MIFDTVLKAAPLAAPLTEWWQCTAPVRAAHPASIERAIALGAHADRLGHAFLGGYTAAITALDPSLGPDALGALCATEAGGGHPRAIQTSLADGRLNGSKHFVSGGAHATVLLVVAKVGEQDGRPQLKVARLGAQAAGVRIEDGAELPFVPEVPHGAVTFTNAAADAVLPGDGYERYLKPFRTIEDLHVFGAVLGCVLANARWPQDSVERLLALLAAIADLGRRDPSSPGVHLALAGLLPSAEAALDALDWSMAPPAFVERFTRDRALLKIAGKVRAQRRAKAWDSYAPDRIADPSGAKR